MPRYGRAPPRCGVATYARPCLRQGRALRRAPASSRAAVAAAAPGRGERRRRVAEAGGDRRRAVAQPCLRGGYRDQFVDERRSRSAARRRRVPRYFGMAQPGMRGAMTDGKNQLPTEARSAEVEQFLENLKKAPAVHPGGGRGRLIFALDAT